MTTRSHYSRLDPSGVDTLRSPIETSAPAAPKAHAISSFRRLEILSLALFAVLALSLGYRLVPDSLLRATAAVAAFGLGVLSMDFISGMFHWAADTWGEIDWPWIGPNVLRTFREHHVDPEAITRHDPIDVNATNAMIALPVLVLGHYIASRHYFGGAVCLSISLGSLATNQIHRYAHSRCVPRWVRVLQRYNLILSPEAHALHHERPYTDHYCITTGWLNHPLARIRFFRRLERVVSAITGAVPRAEDARAAQVIRENPRDY